MKRNNAFDDAIDVLKDFCLDEYLHLLTSPLEFFHYLDKWKNLMRKEIIEVLKSPNGLVWKTTGEVIDLNDCFIYHNRDQRSINDVLKIVRRPTINIEHLLSIHEQVILEPEFKINENLVLR